MAATSRCATPTPCGARRRAATTSPTPSSSSAPASAALTSPNSGPCTMLSSARRSKITLLNSLKKSYIIMTLFDVCTYSIILIHLSSKKHLIFKFIQELQRLPPARDLHSPNPTQDKESKSRKPESGQ